jgi:putative ABC transport system ATP-binding protein
MIRIRELAFRYAGSDFELRVPRLDVDAGERVAIIGPSGSGKTTLLHLVAGIATPVSGSLHTGEVEISALADGARRDFRIRRLGLVFQEFELLEYLSVLDNILLPYRINPSMKLAPEVRERAESLARRVGIADKLGRLVTKLSQGERQRAAVCRALIAEPELLLADEPTGNLDPLNKERVLEILLDYAREHRATLLTVTHDHDLLSRFERVVDFSELQGAAS